jgi:hypothetical protein
MKWLLIFLSFLSLEDIAYAGFDDSILWRYEFASDSSKSYCFNPGYINSPGLGLIFLHTSPYQLRGLAWDFAGLKYGLGRFGFSGHYRSYRLSDLYSANSFSLTGAYKLRQGLDFSISTDLESEEYGQVSKYHRIDAGINLSYARGTIAALGGIRKINLRKPYDLTDIDKPEAIILVSTCLAGGIQINAGYKCLNYGINKWYFSQDVALIKGVGLRLGYISNPALIEWGLDLSRKNITLIFTYQAISRLSDTMILGLSFGV